MCRDGKVYEMLEQIMQSSKENNHATANKTNQTE